MWTRYERRSKVQRVTETEMIVMWARFNKVRRARVVLEVCRKGKANQLETRVTEVDSLRTVLSIQVGIYTQWGICTCSGNRVCVP